VFYASVLLVYPFMSFNYGVRAKGQSKTGSTASVPTLAYLFPEYFCPQHQPGVCTVADLGHNIGILILSTYAITRESHTAEVKAVERLPAEA